MANLAEPNAPEFQATLWRMYRDFFDLAEKKRRWSIRDDIPWEQCNRQLAPEIAHVVESFCAVELHLPDYLNNAVSMARQSMGRTWFYANWGYEESKHSLALGDWLIRSGHRTEEQIYDLQNTVLAGQWKLPHESLVGMLIYAMVQERATAMTYRNLRRRAQEGGGDPALERLLRLLAVDEQAHYSFFQEYIQLYLKHYPDETLDQLREVMNGFQMPAIHQMADGRQRVARIRELNVITEDMYFREVYLPIIESLGVTRAEMRQRVPKKVALGN